MKILQNKMDMVYHRSYCDSPYVKIYSFGGEYTIGNNRCGTFGLSQAMIDVVHSKDYNWTRDEIVTAVGGSKM